MMDEIFAPTFSDEQAAQSRRQHDDVEISLILHELDSSMVFDQVQADSQTPYDIITFGSVRETCPKCKSVHLKLVLRQQNVRLAHLFCPLCTSCFDAHYTNGTSALTI